MVTAEGILFVFIILIMVALLTLFLTFPYWGNISQPEKLKREHEDHRQSEYQRLDDLLNYLRATSEDVTVTDRKFRRVFNRETVDLNSSLDDLMEKPKRDSYIEDDGEIIEMEYRGRYD